MVLDVLSSLFICPYLVFFRSGSFEKLGEVGLLSSEKYAKDKRKYPARHREHANPPHCTISHIKIRSPYLAEVVRE
jgi:hypothetical protein